MMKVCVTRSHIDNSVKKDSHRCMIADAIKEKVPTAQYILVDLQSIRWSDAKTKTRYIYLTPAVAQHRLVKFDQGKSVAPFTFSLRVPHKTRPVGWLGQRSKDAKRARSKKRMSKAHMATLAANRALNHQKEREFGLRKLVE